MRLHLVSPTMVLEHRRGDDERDAKTLTHRHQGENREHTAVQRLPRGAEAITGGAGCQSQRGPLPGGAALVRGANATNCGLCRYRKGKACPSRYPSPTETASLRPTPALSVILLVEWVCRVHVGGERAGWLFIQLLPCALNIFLGPSQ